MEKSAVTRISKPPYDLSTFVGRMRYFFWVTDPRLSFNTSKKLYESRDLLEKYNSKKEEKARCVEKRGVNFVQVTGAIQHIRNREEPPGTSEAQIRRSQQCVLSAFHPDSGDLQNVFGRMSFQVPGGMILIGAMITFYRSTSAIMFWQWANQSFNALVNYTNSNATTEINTKQLVTAYVSATSSALIVALGLRKILANHPSKLLQRFVPFSAVAAANAVNIPLMRQSELKDGVSLFDENDNEIIKSKYAAIKGITQVVSARIAIAAPSMTILPIFMDRLEKTSLLRRYKVLNPICQILFSGFFLLFTVPIGCAIYPQKCSISSNRLNILDSKRVEELRKSASVTLPNTLYFNKGL